jgi:hypothetical protein
LGVGDQARAAGIIRSSLAMDLSGKLNAQEREQPVQRPGGARERIGAVTDEAAG